MDLLPGKKEQGEKYASILSSAYCPILLSALPKTQRTLKLCFLSK